MTTLYSSTRPVKSRKPFAIGLSRPGRERRAPYSAADAAWAAYHLNADSRDYEVVVSAEDRRFDAMAEDARQMDLAERGFRGF